MFSVSAEVSKSNSFLGKIIFFITSVILSVISPPSETLFKISINDPRLLVLLGLRFILRALIMLCMTNESSGSLTFVISFFGFFKLLPRRLALIYLGDSFSSLFDKSEEGYLMLMRSLSASIESDRSDLN